MCCKAGFPKQRKKARTSDMYTQVQSPRAGSPRPRNIDLLKQVKKSRQSLEAEFKENEPATGWCLQCQHVTSHLQLIFYSWGSGWGI